MPALLMCPRLEIIARRVKNAVASVMRIESDIISAIHRFLNTLPAVEQTKRKYLRRPI